MSEAKTKLGRRPCPICTELLWVRSNAAGTVSVSCPECDFSGFAKKGTKAAQMLTPASSPPAAPAAPAPARQAGGFALEGLGR